MRRFGTAFVLFLLSLALASSPAQAQQTGFDPQDLESLDELSGALQVMGTEYADRYVQPVSDALGSGMHAGLFRSAEISGGLIPYLDVYLGVSVSGALMAHSDRTFPATFSEQVQTPTGQTLTLRVQGQANELPTAFGDTSPPNARLVVEGPNGTQVGTALLPPGLVDTPIAPFVVPQLGIGSSIIGTQVQLRYMPETRFRDYGTVGLFGVALQHSLSQYIPLSPLSFGIQGSWSRATLGTSTFRTQAGEVSDVLDASGWAVNVHASKSLPLVPVTFYGGLQYETFNVEYSYTFDPASTQNGALSGFGPLDLTLNQEASNKFRGLAGATITLAVVRLNVDYAIAANDALTIGLGVQL